MTSHRSPVRRTVLAATAAALAALVLTACGDNGHDVSSTGAVSTPSAAASAGAHNAADLDFAQQMITHHRQAVQMAALAATRASSGDVRTLATKIKDAQDPEIETMSGWLTSWGESVPESMAGMDMSSDMPGMMSTVAMDELKDSKGTGFDTMFLEMMVQHHQGAITMARTEKSKGAYGPARELAASVITAQSAEIERMNKLLGDG